MCFSSDPLFLSLQWISRFDAPGRERVEGGKEGIERVEEEAKRAKC